MEAYMRLEGKVAIVTGASSGIGRATARLLAREGAGVVVVARRSSELEALVAEIAAAGGRSCALAGDVRDEGFARETVAAAVAAFGGLDVAVNNAGILGELAPTPDLSLAGWSETIATNLTGAFLGAKHQIPAMLARGGGSLIFTSSFVGYTVGMPGMAAYAASKAGMIALARTIAVEFGARGVRSNAVLPGGTDTAAYRQHSPTADARGFVEGLHAMKRVATPDEIARTILYLASDDSTFTTGTAMLVDGGVSINRV
jgi:NAD(P)-dependent dehydrogenase (short-subunit alcohol dehydrogenase family)